MAEGDAVTERVDTVARRSGWLARSVRMGLAAYGLVHLLFAWVAIRLIFVRHSGAATSEGALAELAREDAGRWTLAALSCAFLALVGWQLLAMAVGYRNQRRRPRLLMRAGAGARAVAYGYFAWASGRLALQGPSGHSRSPQSTTSRIMDAPAGTFLLAILGCVVAGIGLGLAVFGWRKGFLPQLDDTARNADRRVPIVVVGRVGYVVKGVAFVAIGALLVWAAVSHDPQKSGGLDQTLYLLLGGTLGRVAVLVIGVGIGSFGLYLFARARHLNIQALTS
jgi:hypothetical protein